MAKFKRLIERKLLQEKQILLNNGADYNQAVFLAGGAGSGKGFASKNFMQAEKFKRFDVDRWKEDFLKLADKTDRYPELQGLDLRNPEDVSKLHFFVKDKGINNRFVNNVLKNNEQGRLPNVIFDTTLKEVEDLNEFIPLLKQSGYPANNIHLIWVLADYEIAVQRNQDRDRIVPADILLQTHQGAADTVTRLVDKGLPRGVNGAVHVILNNREHTVFASDENGEEIEVSGNFVDDEGNRVGDPETSKVVEGFKYLTLKPEGGSFRNPIEIKETLAQWIRRNAPKTVETWKDLSILQR